MGRSGEKSWNCWVRKTFLRGSIIIRVGKTVCRNWLVLVLGNCLTLRWKLTVMKLLLSLRDFFDSSESQTLFQPKTIDLFQTFQHNLFKLSLTTQTKTLNRY